MSKPDKERVWPVWVANTGLIAIMVATALPLLKVEGDTFRYVFSAGALLVLIGKIFSPYRGDNIRVKRLSRIEGWSAIFFCVAAVFMFYKGVGPMDWLAFTLAGGVLRAYTSFMIPRLQRKS